MNRKFFFFALLFFVTFWICNPFHSDAQLTPKILTILYSNNINGEIEPCPTWGEKNRLGGLAKRGSWVKEVREEQKRILLLDAGDLLFKRYFNPIPENGLKMETEKALLIIESYNLMGYDAIGIGDDDLSLGKEFLVGLSKKANFPFIASNLINKETGKPLFQPYLLKEIDGLKIGIFSLLSPDFFIDRGEPRGKGLTFGPPIEVAQNMVKQLQPKTDLIILLSHLGYSKDMELAQSVPGIHIIVGSHTGINLFYSLVIKNTVILQTGPKGMYGGRFDLTFYNNTLPFFNSRNKKTLEDNIITFKNRLSSKEGTEMERAQWQKSKEQTEQSLEQLQGKQEKNEFTNIIIPLNQQMEDHPYIKSLIETYKEKFVITGKSLPTK